MHLRIVAPRAALTLACLCGRIDLALGADPAKVLHVASPTAETSFDPAFASDAVSDSIIASVFDAMLDYDYLARPVKLVPRALESMPKIEDGGRAFLCKLRKGVYFTPDPAFKGKPRELTAADFAYAFKRLLDPAVKSPWLWVIEGKLVGGDEARARAAKTGRFDYDAPIKGLEIVDRYTLRIRLNAPDLRFPYILALGTLGAQAREVVEAYGSDIGAHPVGTGPYTLGEYRRTAKIVLVANPNYRLITYTPTGPIPQSSEPVAAALKGKPLPLAGRIEINIIEEYQAELLAFLTGELDFMDLLPNELSDQVLDRDGHLKRDLAAKGIVHEVLLRPNTWWSYFNMKDPVVGGYTPEKIALRRAIAMGYDNESGIRIILKGRALPAESLIPRDIPGYDPALKTQAQIYDPAAARALLDRFGYKDRDGDGYRELPDGKSLTIERWSTPASISRESDALWKKNMDAIGIRMQVDQKTFSELVNMSRAGKLMMFNLGYRSLQPSGYQILQTLWSRSPPDTSPSRFSNPDYDAAYEQFLRTPAGPERVKLVRKMSDISQAYVPIVLHTFGVGNTLLYPWVQGYWPSPFGFSWKYLDLDVAKRKAAGK